MSLSRRTWTLLIVGLVLAPPGLFTGFLSYSRHRFAQRWELVQPGMSGEQVKSMLGNPKKIWPRGTAGLFVHNQLEEWTYGPRFYLVRVSGFPYVFPGIELFGPGSRDCVVSFDDSGNVVKKDAPR